MELVWLAKILWMLLAYLAGVAGGVFAHELGHALAALGLTRQPVQLQVGRDGKAASLVLGRLVLRCSWRGLRYGFTRYDRGAESRARQSVVALCGPLATVLLTGLFLLALARSPSGSWAWAGWLGLFVANLRILVISLWPAPHRPDGPEGEVWLSDALDLWRMWRR